jgi:putative intracellular protease/amidase
MAAPAPVPAPVVVLVYDGVAADEARAVVDILAKAGLAVIVASVASPTVTSYHGQVVPSCTVDALGPISALVVPGGMGVRQAAGHQTLLAAIRKLGGPAPWIGATSTGSVLLAAAGVVPLGARMTTHWLAGDLITDHGLRLVSEPFVEHGRLLTASGLASTGSLALRLVGALAGVEVETAARRHYQPGRGADPRYRPPPSWWRTIGRRRVVDLAHPVDPDGQAQLITILLDEEPGS